MASQGCLGMLICQSCLWTVVFLLIAFFANKQNDYRNAIYANMTTRVEAWVKPEGWQDESCDVLLAGVAYRGDGCDYRKPYYTGGSEFSECPGLAICALEGEHCECDGQVTYAATAYADRMPMYLTDDVESDSVSIDSTGSSISCSHTADSGAFHRDPASGHLKACFCTPRGVLDNISKVAPGQTVGEAQRLAWIKQDMQDYFAPTPQDEPKNRSIALAENRPLQDGREESDHLRRGRKLAEIAAHATYYVAGGNSEWRPCSKNDNYPEGKEVYEPWALVKLTSGGKSRLRCAYNYGVAVASRTTSIMKASIILKDWKDTNASIPCSVRKISGSVALGNLKKLVKEQEDISNLGGMASVMWMPLGIFGLAALICIGLSMNDYYQNRDYYRNYYSTDDESYERQE